MTKNIYLAICCFLLLTLSGADVASQNNPKLSPQQAAVVEQLKEELGKIGRSLGKIGRSRHIDATEMRQIIDVGLKNLDPILVGKHVVFSKKWLDYVGTNKPLTRQQFEHWRNRIDKVYDCFADLTGQPPAGGKKIFIDIGNQNDLKLESYKLAHAHNRVNIICFARDSKRFLPLVMHEIKTGSTSYTMIHEMAHIFADNKRWEAESESIANFLTMYALENAGFWYGMPSPRPPNIKVLTRGKELRTRTYKKLLESFQKNKIKPFQSDYEYDSVYDAYLMGLVEIVGWNTIKKAIRSYNDTNYVPKRKYQGDPKIVASREFFDRIEHFSGQKNVLRSGPDRGSLLDQYFPVKITPINNTPSNTYQLFPPQR